MVILKDEGNEIERPILWMFFILCHCFMLLKMWNSVQEEANKSVIILHDIWNKYAEKRGIDKRLLYLQFISMRFLTCKLKFTAYGFFPLDWTFLHTIIASATTYIIILVQLKK
ncbi:gustatory and pheromone receptor 33a-like isoform X3 [Harmonia axyridis]|uniref:gustatory and pheromone receptor 33a-like isoform X3 n=1 Tax=Harmonia axyridis TaxID=115357 RepID=UPI001E2794C8|nr:gustatory and pheromone receptor 33a-like isoform X3 [Harmonia axyridis]